MALLFTPEVMSSAASSKRPETLGWLARWAREPREFGPRVREQLERLGSLVPELQRGAVLGPILSASSPEARVRDAVGVLMLAHTLRATGWSVEFNPEVDGLTPDLLVRKQTAEFLVEVRRVTGLLARETSHDTAYRKIEHALGTRVTRTPIYLVRADIDGQASLKRFVNELMELLDGGIASIEGERTIAYDGVSVTFEVMDRLEFDCPVLGGGLQRFAMGNEADLVPPAVEEKVHKYKTPLIVALDLVGLGDGFNAVHDAIAGARVFRIPIDLSHGGAVGGPTLGRLDDSRLGHERLLGVLAFEWRLGGSWLHVVEPRLFPTIGVDVDGFRDFAPIPVQALGGDEPPYWSHTP